MKKELIDIVRKLKDMDAERVKYLETIPQDISAAFFDNVYVNLLYKQSDMLIDALFGDHAEDVTWFLYEFTAGKSAGPHCILADGTEYTYNTNEDYYAYLEQL